MRASLFDISGAVPLSQTIFLWQGRLPANREDRAATPGKWLEHSPALSILATGLIFTYLVQVFRASSNGLLAALKSERLLSDLHRGGPAALAAHPVSTRACREHPCQLRSIAAIPARRNDRG